MRYALLFLLGLTGCNAVAPDPEPKSSVPSSIAELTSGMTSIPGFIPIWWNPEDGKVYLELPGQGQEFLYWVSLSRGLGSNDVGLDRGQIGDQWLVRTLRTGNQVLLVVPNLDWRSDSDDPAVRRAVVESFAESVIFGFELKAESGGRLLVDATEFLKRDAHHIAQSLDRSGQGNFSLQSSRSAVLGEELRGFPDNSQLDALLTFTSDSPGSEVRATAADARSVSMRVRHSFVRLPEPGFEQRAYHPSSGFWEHRWKNLSSNLASPLATQSLVRHRLQKQEPDQESSWAIEPIVYYIDRGAPEPIRTALLEGARYWGPVFEKAGFPGGFRAELLPLDADPHDVRYNIVQWANRSTRGWSYGNAVKDPRTGEIIKGHVTLGALRVRQDLLLADGLLSPHSGSDQRSIEMALARVRQLSAHEIGHTLGLAHNFAASANGRASVMDYPAPMIEIDAAGELDLSNAYREGCGKWDELAIRYGYADFSWQTKDEAEALADVIDEARKLGLRYLTDRDARGNDRAHPFANLWDNGEDPVAYLEHEVEVRRIALAQFNRDALRAGRPLTELEEVLIPVYLHHRYQVEAAARSIGGVEYEYELKQSGEQAGVRTVGAELQKRALTAVLKTLDPSFLALPESIRELIPPRSPGSSGNRELQSPQALLLDPLEMAGSSIEVTLNFLLDPGRATRLVDQANRDSDQLSFEVVISSVLQIASQEGSPEHQPLRELLKSAVTRRLMEIAADERVPVRTREPANRALHLLAAEAESGSLELDALRRFFEDPSSMASGFRASRIPPGSPIGCDYAW